MGIGLISILVFAAFEWQPMSAYTQALGTASVAVAYGADGFLVNPAGLANEPFGMEFGATYENHFGGLGVGLAGVTASFAKNFGNKGIALSVSDFGAKLEGDYSGRYSEKTIKLGYAMALTEKVSIGLSANYFIFDEPRFGSKSALGIDLGMAARFYAKWRVGFVIHNLNAPKISGEQRDYELPRHLAFGVALKPFRQTETTVDFVKEFDRPLRIAFGQSVDFGNFAIAGGVSSESEFIQFGFGLLARFKFLEFQYGATVTPELPVTHTFTVKFRR